jgi:hypothetical protein
MRRRLQTRRTRCALILVAALGTTVLTACGSATAPAVHSKAAAATGDETGSPEFFAYISMLQRVEKPCRKDKEAKKGVRRKAASADFTEAPSRVRPTGDVPLPSDATPPSGSDDTSADPERLREEVDLSSYEKCTARVHQRRITDAVRGGAGADPARVGAQLRRLGYYEDVLDGPMRAKGGTAARFTVDLRFMGGRLCLGGEVTAAGTRFDPYGGAPEVPCREVRRDGKA